MGALRPVHILILVLVVLILFGFKKLPDAARSLGRSMRIFKSEVEEMKKDGQSTPSAASSDTVKGETFHPPADSAGSAADSSSGPIADPTKRAAADPVERQKHNQSPS